MKYKGFEAKVELDEEDNIFVGKVINTRHCIGFHGSSIEELKYNFHELIDFHLQSVSIDDKPYSGKISLRIDPKTHADIARYSQTHGISVNKFINNNLKNTIKNIHC
jgi:predicted HicB family RNase H-like nuclease